MEHMWFRLLIGGAILIALISLAALEVLTSRMSVDQHFSAFTTQGR